MTDHPGFTPESVVRTMSLRRRVAVVLVGLAGAGGAALVLLLWLTEPAGLPARTRAAFSALIVVGSSWAVYATWALSRMPLFAADRVVAGRLALTFSAVTAAVTVAVTLTRPGPVAAAATAVALLTVAAAARVLRRATVHKKGLQAAAQRLAGPPR